MTDEHEKPQTEAERLLLRQSASPEYISAIIEQQRDLVRTVIAVLKHDPALRRELRALLAEDEGTSE